MSKYCEAPVTKTEESGTKVTLSLILFAKLEFKCQPPKKGVTLRFWVDSIAMSRACKRDINRGFTSQVNTFNHGHCATL